MTIILRATNLVTFAQKLQHGGKNKSMDVRKESQKQVGIILVRIQLTQ